jgi:hypothetical protein
MENLVQISLMIARKKMQGMGFNDEQIDRLLETGKRDLENEFAKLKSLIESDEDNAEAINQSLHALKGLLLNLGNEKLAARFIELRSNESLEEKKRQLMQLLFDR